MNIRNKVFRVSFKIIFILVLAVSLGSVWARDEKSIKDLRNAIVALGPDVDPNEAELLSVTVHTMSRELAHEYRIVINPSFQNMLIKMHLRQKGYCAHYVRDMGWRLREMTFKTLVLHWGAAYAKEPDENNALVVTARNQPFEEGIVLDAWRRAGRLYWCAIRDDHEYELLRSNALNRLGGRNYSGITAWKEDLEETAWLQKRESVKAEPKSKPEPISKPEAISKTEATSKPEPQ